MLPNPQAPLGSTEEIAAPREGEGCEPNDLEKLILIRNLLLSSRCLPPDVRSLLQSDDWFEKLQQAAGQSPQQSRAVSATAEIIERIKRALEERARR